MNTKLTWFDKLMMAVTFAEAGAPEPEIVTAKKAQKKTVSNGGKERGGKTGFAAPAAARG